MPRSTTTAPKAEPNTKPAPQTNKDAPPSAPPATKLDTLITLLRRPQGASLEEMMAATGWQRHSIRGALAGGIRKKLGAGVISEKTDGVRRYRIPGHGA